MSFQLISCKRELRWSGEAVCPFVTRAHRVSIRDARVLSRRYVVLAQLAIQRLAVQAERPCGGSFVSRHRAERAEDVVAFHVCERSPRVRAASDERLLA